MFSDDFAQLEGPRIAESYPAFLNNPGGALWTQRAAP